MKPFIYNNPTKVVFEEEGVKKLGEMLLEQNCKKILIVYGGKSSEKSGLIDEVINQIQSIKMEYAILKGIVPNPLLSKVEEGMELGKKEKIDFILAVGGGSVIDTAKAIGVGIFEDGNVWDFFEGKRVVKGCIPVGTILTIPAAGSEMSNSSVITKDEGLLKRSFGSTYSICKFAILDPALTLTLPEYQTSCGCVDIMMHTMERYFSKEGTLELTDSIAEAILKTVMKYAKILIEEPGNMEARWNVMWAGSLSHNGLTNCGGIRGDWATHHIEHELGGMYDVAHGAGLAAIWASWARYVVNIIPERFAKFAVNVMGVEDETDKMKVALEGIKAVEEFYRSINMPTSLNELGVNPTSQEIEEMGKKGSNNDTKVLGSVKELNSKDISIILNNANH